MFLPIYCFNSLAKNCFTCRHNAKKHTNSGFNSLRLQVAAKEGESNCFRVVLRLSRHEFWV
ncbi:hypothetical protein Hanom_Chr09g00761691 [Helianthus anomalus]